MAQISCMARNFACHRDWNPPKLAIHWLAEFGLKARNDHW